MMITMDILLEQIGGLDRRDVERWILNTWVQADDDFGHYSFQEIDVARVRLIHELRDDLLVNEDALPVVLLLLDQLYDVRREMTTVNAMLDRLASRIAPSEIL